MQETLSLISAAIEDKRSIHHTVVNAGKIVSMHENPELKESVVNADLINADGQACSLGFKFFGQPLKERVAGIDLMKNLVALAHEKNTSFSFRSERRSAEKTG